MKKLLPSFSRHALLYTPGVVAGVLMLAACASEPQKPLKQPHDSYGANEENSSNATASSPGYKALKAGRYMEARNYIEATNARRPNDAFDELNLGAAYQNSGRMDLAEPLLRQAMTHGHGLRGVETTKAWASGKTVEDIACENLSMGLRPASIDGTATRCQTTVVIAVADRPAADFALYSAAPFNTYFEFDEARLTREGREIVQTAARKARSDPSFQVYLLGKADSVGTSSYNWQLSRDRAITVRDELIAEGVPANKISIRWVGESELPVAEREGEREHLNRVVEGDMQK